MGTEHGLLPLHSFPCVADNFCLSVLNVPGHRERKKSIYDKRLRALLLSPSVQLDEPKTDRPAKVRTEGAARYSIF